MRPGLSQSVSTLLYDDSTNTHGINIMIITMIITVMSCRQCGRNISDRHIRATRSRFIARGRGSARCDDQEPSWLVGR
ncbi:uncharacterized protein K489DRAFT_380041 [Dissoconium aciculare CBS 342.82]|uniref:Uncharacterized protein n=1 Tax=Dissoconium aciculare CBS 342.82 TaxID=1314786 RepID=A0A6J3M447_9PEZI|nr:uncharacterized protein K489DRAFT_380041 [Dissoconium aciculare CBS 342.82]KAF1822673.1 hypothetical protein K489DRAFT_380041 [Dissoconium aciculare CBS 342.82]